MATKSRIEWTESTWNPITGCTKVSPGCKNCYAERMALRLKAMGVKNYKNGFDLTMHEELIELPLSWKKPQMIFVNSMSDLFHQDVTDEFIFALVETMRKSPWHKYQILTKRAERLEEISSRLSWPDNVWVGITVESEAYTYRINHLNKVQSSVRFISFEPLLSRIWNVDLSSIDWAIIGGESGPNSRPIEKEWILRLKEICERDHTAFYFKQWGGKNKKKTGNLLDGIKYLEFPLTQSSFAPVS